MQHGVSSSLFPGVVRVGLCKWARFRCSRNEPSFLVELRMPISTTPTRGVRNHGSSMFLPFSLAGVCGAGSLRREGERPADGDNRFVSHADLLSRLSRAEVPSDEANEYADAERPCQENSRTNFRVRERRVIVSPWTGTGSSGTAPGRRVERNLSIRRTTSSRSCGTTRRRSSSPSRSQPLGARSPTTRRASVSRRCRT
jgi:hypothetical protein